MANVSEKLTLLDNASSTGDAEIATIGGRYVLSVNGTFGGATVQFQFLGPNGSAYIDIANASFTTAGSVSVDIAQGSNVRATLTGGAPSAMFAHAVRAPQ